MRQQPTRLRCKKCSGGIYFTSISNLRRHQWAVHTESFDALRLAASKVNRKQVAQKHKKRAAQLPTVALAPAPVPPPELSARELLQKLKEQNRFLTDVCNLVEGILQAGGNTR